MELAGKADDDIRVYSLYKLRETEADMGLDPADLEEGDDSKETSGKSEKSGKVETYTAGNEYFIKLNGGKRVVITSKGQFMCVLELEIICLRVLTTVSV